MELPNWGGDVLNPPYKSSGETDRGQVLQPVERALDAPAQLVETLTEAERLFPVAAIWNERLEQLSAAVGVVVSLLNDVQVALAF